MSYPPPPVVRPRFRVTRFGGGCSDAFVDGEVASEACFRFKEALARDGVFPVDAGVDAEGWGGCGIVLCCFRGELEAEGGAFWGELIVEVVGAEEGLVMEAGALEYNVTAGLGGGTPLGLAYEAKGCGGPPPLLWMLVVWFRPFIMGNGPGCRFGFSRSLIANFDSASVLLLSTTSPKACR